MRGRRPVAQIFNLRTRWQDTILPHQRPVFTGPMSLADDLPAG